ncbi:penicillin-binding protein [Gracilinema caldarium]|uniref:Peptidoglycan glycosyltransferase n=1 Tax=Gracilinema caldarium (strain ATCC 51460 / DSM 7334 / H1) TaxID=744872 RepID=F8F1N0_GRAC1|nr:penicillin-binding protein [Gracilinema caldarium]AEJ19364.1 Peptidoglycan glycosyltransferase [Gracilinema caldarium DSM 7334]
MEAVPPKKGRIIVFTSLFMLFILFVYVRYAQLMLFPEAVDQNTEKNNLIERGPILDRNGTILAMQTRLGNITIWKPEAMTALEESSKLLAPLVDMEEKAIIDRVQQSNSSFIYLKKRLDQSVLGTIENLIKAGKLPGIAIEPIMGRIYPEKNLASNLIGFVGDENQGLGGLEYAFESDLAPQNGQLYGNQLILTIDTKVQYTLEQIADQSMEENKAEAVILIAMTPQTGDILGYVSLPNFNPNEISSSTEQERMDRPAIWAYEPGSVFKVFSLASMLDTGAITPNSTFICDGQYEQTTSGGEKITIKCLGAHGTVHPQEIITYSCNAGAAYASDQINAQTFYTMIQQFGFGMKTGIGIPGETSGYLRPINRWSARSKPTIAIGQEISVSALQMVQAATAIANDGLLVPPRIVARVLNHEGKLVRDLQTGIPRQILKPETARELRKYMLAASSEAGTGRRARVDDIPIGVKTGTAQIIDPKTGTYSKTDYIASTLALVPADQPSLILYMVIIRPKGDSYLGGRIAAPAIREASEELANYLGIPRGKSLQVEHPGTVVLNFPPTIAMGENLPDLRGYSKKQLLPLLLQDDITVEIDGDGWVKKQIPDPGTPITKGMVIHLELE